MKATYMVGLVNPIYAVVACILDSKKLQKT